MDWIDIKKENPDIGEYVLVICPRMGNNGETEILVAQYKGDNEWYSGFPIDQEVNPTHWSYSLTVNK